MTKQRRVRAYRSGSPIIARRHKTPVEEIDLVVLKGKGLAR
ncbi:MAG: hypothetical protein ACXWKB_03465 [Methyloceanibacter sp.]